MKPRLLVVDDEPDMLDFVERAFRVDYVVLRAPGGAEALDLILEVGPVQVLVADHHMPGMTGLELVRAVRTRYPGVATVLLSGMDEVPVEETVVDAAVGKPIDSDELRFAVEQAVAASRTRAP